MRGDGWTAGAKVCESSPVWWQLSFMMQWLSLMTATWLLDFNRVQLQTVGHKWHDMSWHDMTRVTPGWGGASSVWGKGPWRRDAACHVWGRGSLLAMEESRSGASQASCLEENSIFSESKPNIWKTIDQLKKEQWGSGRCRSFRPTTSFQYVSNGKIGSMKCDCQAAEICKVCFSRNGGWGIYILLLIAVKHLGLHLVRYK